MLYLFSFVLLGQKYLPYAVEVKVYPLRSSVYLFQFVNDYFFNLMYKPSYVV